MKMIKISLARHHEYSGAIYFTLCHVMTPLLVVVGVDDALDGSVVFFFTRLLLPSAAVGRAFVVFGSSNGLDPICAVVK